MEKPVLKLSGEDGNVFMVLGRARRVAVKHGMDWEKIKKEAEAGDYWHVINTLQKYFEVE